MKKVISLILAIITIATLFTCNLAYANCTSSHIFTNKKCGENLFCTLENGTLTISGNGKMYDYDQTIQPWDLSNICNDMACDFKYDVIVENGVTSIGNSAFENCYNIKKIIIPESIVNIGEKAFILCDGLTEIQVAENNSTYCSVDGVLFSKDKKTLIRYPSGKEGSEYVIPNGVTTIAQTAFHYSNLENITIPEGVKNIESEGFLGSRNLVSLTIPSSVETIHNSAFHWCDNLTIYGEENSAAHSNAAANEIPFVIITQHNTENNLISVKLDGTYLFFDQPPMLINNRTMVPIRVIFEAMGYTVNWDDETQTATSTKDDDLIVVQLNNNIIKYTVNNVSGEYICDVVPQIVSNRTLVPARAIAESAGCTVNWDSNLYIVLISTK